jgi:transposase
MAGWRRAVELAISGEEIETLMALSRSRTEPASRVSRAAMLLAYREHPSFFAVGQRLGVHHQTVQRCVERAVAYGALAALEDRPRPGKEPTITPEAKAWLVSLACDKAKEHGYPHELWTTRLLARHARENGPAAGHDCLANLVQGTVCKLLGHEEIKPHKVRYYLERRDAEFEQKMAEVLCVYREVQVLKKVLKKAAAKPKKPGKPVAIVSYDEKPGIQAIATTAPDLPPVPGAYATFARDYEYKRHGTLSLLAGIDLLTGKVHALVRDRHRSREFIEFLKLLDAAYPARTAIKPSSTTIRRTSPEKPKRGLPLNRQAASSSPSRPSTAPGSTSSRASSLNLPARSCVTSEWHQNTNSKSALSPASMTSIAIPSSTPGPTSSPRLPDMIQTMETLT